jgi:hypothetical protein
MRHFVLTEDQAQLVALCLKLGAEQFRKDAEECADNPRLVEAFTAQANQAEAMIVQIDNAIETDPPKQAVKKKGSIK